jgi:pantothenate kinase-related protein Tda10
MPMKEPIPRSDELLDRLQEALTPNRLPHRLPLLTAVDGADGIGKSSLASWLAWQLGMPAVQLDLYLTCLKPVRQLTEELQRVVAHRIDRKRPLIIDGVLALDALDQIGRKADSVIFVMSNYTTSPLASQVEEYQSRRELPQRANFIIDGYSE